MTLTLGFDVYGTLIDTHGVIVELEQYIADLAPQFSLLWREKQLEYTFRRGLMGQYQHFGICTRQALEYADQHLQCGLTADQKSALIHCYATLPAFADVPAGLEQATGAGFRLYAFSNGQGAAVDTVLANAGIAHYFEGTVSADEINTFKPSPAVYKHFIAKTETTQARAWLISSNGFDVIGAVSAGMKAMWVQRSPSIVLDPWEVKPTVIVSGLSGLSDIILNAG